MKIVLALIAVLGSCLAWAADGLPGAPPGPSAGPAPHGTLRVTAVGHAQAAPDVALVTIAVTSIDTALARATRQANDAARRVADVLASAGVASADQQTAHYDVQIERRAPKPGDAPRVAGYRVSNAIRVKVRDLSKLGGMLDRVVAAGANEIESLAFVKEDTTPEESRALAAAVRAARVKAEEMARAANVRLGSLLEMSESVSGPIRPMAMRAMRMEAGEVPVQGGQVQITARVDAVFTIE